MASARCFPGTPLRRAAMTVGATAAICALSAATVLAAGGTPRAATPWSAPVALPTSTAPTVLTFTADGHAIAGSASGTTSSGAVLAANPGTSTFTEIGAADLLVRPATYGRDDVAYLRTAVPSYPEVIADPPKLKVVAELGVSLGTASSLGRFQRLARLDITQSGAVTAAIAADPRGDVAVVWLAPSGSRTLVRFALRPAGHAFEPTTTLGLYSGADYDTPLSVAYGTNGDLVVVFQGTSEAGHVTTKTLRLVARVKRAGAVFGPIRVIGPAQGATSLASAVAPNGRAVVGWGTARSGGTNLDGTWSVRAALLAPHAKSFAPAQLLDPGGLIDEPNTGVKVAIGTDGTATVAWSGVTAVPAQGDQGFGVYPARVATAGPTAGFGPTTQLAPDAAVFGVVTASNGTTTILLGPLSDLDNTIDQILATRRPAGASSFSAPEAVSPPESLPPSATLAVNPHTRALAALWLPAGAQANPPAPVTAQYSTRGA
jgi:hypothetical protein